ncbi:hypothetical protein EYF80_046891 [Liparis tanakae]|uniref:Uncharacterized protein n=1 Tax=Liparis tanakae TaxID=230148 RepID=A0A4Z2FP31_9TELE|nr:hypothetical protein EYF80_046891 [Liparis tanakae]
MDAGKCRDGDATKTKTLRADSIDRSLITAANGRSVFAGLETRVSAGKGEEIKHFNYRRLAGGAGYRQRSCNEDG